MKSVVSVGAVKGRPNLSKFGNRKTVVDGITFASLREARRYADLKLLERGGVIEKLELQPKFPIAVNGVKVCTYVADFRYFDRQKGAFITEDAKGMRTPVYILKKKLVRAVHGVDIVEV